MAKGVGSVRNYVRRFPRYNVSSWKHIVARIDRHRQSEQIVMVGAGGCGFYGFESNYPGHIPLGVSCEFEFQGGSYQKMPPILVQGNVIYSMPIDVGSVRVFFYGVEFLPAEREKIQPLISVLEVLHMAKIIPLT